MLQYMITRCALLLRSYKTTLEEDQALFKETTVITKSLKGHDRTEDLIFIPGPDQSQQYSAQIMREENSGRYCGLLRGQTEADSKLDFLHFYTFVRYIYH